jgi:hypothetical protein
MSVHDLTNGLRTSAPARLDFRQRTAPVATHPSGLPAAGVTLTQDIPGAARQRELEATVRADVDKALVSRARRAVGSPQCFPLRLSMGQSRSSPPSRRQVAKMLLCASSMRQ